MGSDVGDVWPQLVLVAVLIVVNAAFAGTAKSASGNVRASRARSPSLNENTRHSEL